MNVKDIHTINWQMSLKGPDTVVEGTLDIEQAIGIILRTRKGEDPLRPHFGCALFDRIDRPVSSAIPNMKKDILEALTAWEPRITIKSITASLKDLSNVIFNIGYQTPEGNLETYQFALSGDQTGGTTAPLSLTATYQDGAFRYYINLSLDGTEVFPSPPPSGFDSISSMMDWLHNNWYIYGTWFWVFGQKKIVLYVPANIAQSGSLEIISDTNVLSAFIPALTNPNSYYLINFKDDSNDQILPVSDNNIVSKGDILNFVQTNYGSYGTWSIDNDTLILNGSVDITNYSLNIQNRLFVQSAFTQGFDKGFQA